MELVTDMKLMIASDIHGSAAYCKMLLERFNEEKPDKLILLGDILYHGPRNDLPLEYAPKQVISMLNEIKESLICVRGNCDTEVDQMVLEFPVLADYGVIFYEGKTIYLTHGHTYNQNNPLPMPNGSIMMNGHTHIPMFKDFGNYTLINPGSVSIPKENSHHGYIILSENNCIFKDVTSGLVVKEEKI